MKKIVLISGLALVPGIAFAQASGFTIITDIGNLVSLLTPVIVALALLFFFWGLAKYILAAGDETAQAAGKQIMIWGIIALFVIVAVWGLVQVLASTFKVDTGTTSGTIPSVDI